MRKLHSKITSLREKFKGINMRTECEELKQSVRDKVGIILVLTMLSAGAGYFVRETGHIENSANIILRIMVGIPEASYDILSMVIEIISKLSSGDAEKAINLIPKAFKEFKNASPEVQAEGFGEFFGTFLVPWLTYKVIKGRKSRKNAKQTEISITDPEKEIIEEVEVTSPIAETIDEIVPSITELVTETIGESAATSESEVEKYGILNADVPKETNTNVLSELTSLTPILGEKVRGFVDKKSKPQHIIKYMRHYFSEEIGKSVLPKGVQISILRQIEHELKHIEESIEHGESVFSDLAWLARDPIRYIAIKEMGFSSVSKEIAEEAEEFVGAIEENVAPAMSIETPNDIKIETTQPIEPPIFLGLGEIEEEAPEFKELDAKSTTAVKLFDTTKKPADIIRQLSDYFKLNRNHPLYGEIMKKLLVLNKDIELLAGYKAENKPEMEKKINGAIKELAKEVNEYLILNTKKPKKAEDLSLDFTKLKIDNTEAR